MGIWSEVQRVARDQTGGAERIRAGLERNPDAAVELGAANAPGVPLFVLRVPLRGGFGQTRAGLPVFRRTNPSPHPILKEIYHCEVAGKVLEAANIFALREKVEHQLEVIAPARTLPLCYFRAPRYDYSLPVYEQGSKLVCPVLAGPKIKADDLAELRSPLVRHLRTAGYLGPDEDPEVHVVRPSDLRLVPPAAVIRSLEDPEVWLPAVEGSSSDGPVVGLLSHPAELRAAVRRARGPVASDVPPSGPDVTALLRYLGVELARRGKLTRASALYACDVRDEIWARTEELTDTTGRVLSARLEVGEELAIPVLHTAAGESVAGIRDRGIAVFLASDDEALCSAVGAYLAAEAHLGHADDLRRETVAASGPDRLDPDSIWTDERASTDFAAPTAGQPSKDQEVSST